MDDLQRHLVTDRETESLLFETGQIDPAHSAEAEFGLNQECAQSFPFHLDSEPTRGSGRNGRLAESARASGIDLVGAGL